MIAAPGLNPGFLFFKIRVKLLALIRLHAMGEVGQFYDTLLTYISFVACVVLCAYPRLLLRTGQICTQHGSDRIRMRQQLSGGGRGLGPMSSKQLGEFIDQKALHGYGDLPGHVAAPSQHSKPTERAPKSLRLRLSCSRNSALLWRFLSARGSFLSLGRCTCPHNSTESSRKSACSGPRKQPRMKTESTLRRWQKRGCTPLRSWRTRRIPQCKPPNSQVAPCVRRNGSQFQVGSTREFWRT